MFNLKKAIFTYAIMTSIALFANSYAADSRFDQAVVAYQRVIAADDSDAIEKAITQFDEVLAENPKEYRSLIYKGSLTARSAKSSWMPWKKLKLANTGIDMMDKGIDALKTNTTDAHLLIEGHMVRGITSARMPKMFKRYAIAGSDFKFIREHAAFSKMGLVNQATVMAFSAVLAHRAEAEGDAVKFLDAARKLDSGTAEKIWAER